MRPDPSDKSRIEGVIAFIRYLSWADLQRQLFYREMGSGSSEIGPEAIRCHEWRWFGLMCYWYASLYVVIEAWVKLGFVDPKVDELLSHPRDLRNLLRLFRNAVFHHHESLLTPKILDLLSTGETHVYWVQGLHGEVVRALQHHLSEWVVTDGQRAELRQSIEDMVNWYPSADSRVIESFEKTLARAQEVLRQEPGDGSEVRRSLEEAVQDGLRVLAEGRENWRELRAEILGKAAS